MVAGPVVEAEPDAHERLPGADLEVLADRRPGRGRRAALGIGGQAAWPVVGAGDDDLATQRPGALDPDIDLERLIDDDVVRRRTVVVAVAGLPAVDDAPDAGQLRAPAHQPECPVLVDLEADQPVVEASLDRDDRVVDRLDHGGRPVGFAHPDVGQCRDGDPRQQPASLRGADVDRPQRVRPARGGRSDIGQQSLDVQLGRFGPVVGADEDPRQVPIGVDGQAVDLPSEQLAVRGGAGRRTRRPRRRAPDAPRSPCAAVRPPGSAAIGRRGAGRRNPTPPGWRRRARRGPRDRRATG